MVAAELVTKAVLALYEHVEKARIVSRISLISKNKRRSGQHARKPCCGEKNSVPPEIPLLRPVCCCVGAHTSGERPLPLTYPVWLADAPGFPYLEIFEIPWRLSSDVTAANPEEMKKVLSETGMARVLCADEISWDAPHDATSANLLLDARIAVLSEAFTQIRGPGVAYLSVLSRWPDQLSAAAAEQGFWQPMPQVSGRQWTAHAERTVLIQIDGKFLPFEFMTYAVTPRGIGIFH